MLVEIGGFWAATMFNSTAQQPKRNCLAGSSFTAETRVWSSLHSRQPGCREPRLWDCNAIVFFPLVELFVSFAKSSANQNWVLTKVLPIPSENASFAQICQHAAVQNFASTQELRVTNVMQKPLQTATRNAKQRMVSCWILTTLRKELLVRYPCTTVGCTFGEITNRHGYISMALAHSAPWTHLVRPEVVEAKFL